MALLSLEKLDVSSKERNSVHAVAYAKYCFFEKDGHTYFQIDTYGSSERECPGKVSQSIQLDQETAKFFIDLLKLKFDII